MPKEYKLVEMIDILEIPEDRFDMFLVDLKKWHKSIRIAQQLIKESARISGKKIAASHMNMTWIDDNKHEGKITIKQITQKPGTTGK